MTTEDLKAVAYDKTGRIRIHVDGTLHTLGIPKFGQFRKIKGALNDAQTAIQSRLEDQGIDQHDNEAIAKDSELQDIAIDAMANAIKVTFAELSDNELSDDIDEWPTWLVLSQSMVAEFVHHWQTVPLVRG